MKLAPAAVQKMLAIQKDYSERYGRPVDVWSAISIGLIGYDMRNKLKPETWVDRMLAKVGLVRASRVPV